LLVTQNAGDRRLMASAREFCTIGPRSFDTAMIHRPEARECGISGEGGISRAIRTPLGRTNCWLARWRLGSPPILRVRDFGEGNEPHPSELRARNGLGSPAS